MKRASILLTACALVGMCYTSQAQETKNNKTKEGTQTEQEAAEKAVRGLMDALLQKIRPQSTTTEAAPVRNGQVVTTTPDGRPMESNNGKTLWAKSFLNRQAPQLSVDKWLTEVPDTEGKFVLIDFWGPACPPCKASIPDLNAFSKQFADDLVVIGVSLNKEQHVRAMKTPVIEYYSALDTTKHYIKKFEIKGYPHAVLLDTRGIVRWEGNPEQQGHELTAEIIGNLIKKYDYEDGGVARNMAKPFLGEKAPDMSVREWYPKEPKIKGKFVLRDFFSFMCGPCRQAIPKLNKWNKEFADDLVIIGCAKDGIQRLLTIEPKIEYTLASDPKGEIWQAMELHVLSYVQLIDPKGIVRWEGLCIDLTTDKIREIIEKYK